MNYGLESWQTEYVNVNVQILNSKGEALADGFQNLSEDTTYSIAVTIEPKTDGSGSIGTPAVGNGDRAGSEINVYSPKLTFKDSTVYYGDSVPAFDNNLAEKVWMHGSTESGTVKMMGTEPVLTIDYSPTSGTIQNGILTSSQDVAVDVSVKLGKQDITDRTAFAHQDCDGGCGWPVTDPDGSPAFMIHAETCQLTITKTGGETGEPYVFTVKKDGVEYTELTIVGNGSVTIYALPIGTYTIEEDTGWSWRYTVVYIGNGSLSKESDSGELVCKNNLSNHYWLNGFSSVVKNIFTKQEGVAK